MSDAPVKLFVSYRSTDSVKVDPLVARLNSLKQPDGTPRFQIWQDKTGIPAGKDWWAAIVDAIIDCQVFIFCISEAALSSDVCRAELRYARERNRPIIPVVLEGEYQFNTTTGKEDVAYWDKIPSQLTDRRSQFLFYNGTAFYAQLDKALVSFAQDAASWRDIYQPRPSDPRTESGAHVKAVDIYDEACDYAGRLEFETARSLFRKLIDRNQDFSKEAYEWIELLGKYEELSEMDARATTRFRVGSLWNTYKMLFPKDFLEGMFDPKDFSARFDQSISAPLAPPLGTDNAVAPNAQPPTNVDTGSLSNAQGWRPDVPSPTQNTQVVQHNQSGHNINVSGSNNTIAGGNIIYNTSVPTPPPSSTPRPNRESFNAVVALLLPYMSTEGERRALITKALYECRVLPQIAWSGTPQTFTVQLVQTLLNFGQCSPGEPAVVLVLQELREQVGDQKQAEIDRLAAIYSA